MKSRKPVRSAQRDAAPVALRPRAGRGSITDVDGIRVGHFTDPRRPTGCTVVLSEGGAFAGVDIRGAAPGSRKTDLLNPVNTVEQRSRPSCCRAEAPLGWMLRLAWSAIWKSVALVTRHLSPGFPSSRRPSCMTWRSEIPVSGRMRLPVTKPARRLGPAGSRKAAWEPGLGRAMKGGIGTASIRVGASIVVGAIVAVNASGDIVEPGSGRILAGALKKTGTGFLNIMEMLRLGRDHPDHAPASTTIGVVATNVRFTKTQMTKIAQMAHDGLARVIHPAHTSFDGDAVFALSTASSDTRASLGAIGALAADVISEAVIRAVTCATSAPGFPSFRDVVIR